MGSDFSSFIGDVVDVVTTPFKEVVKAISGTISDNTQAQIEGISNVVHATGIDDLASDIVGGVTDIAGGVVDHAGNLIDHGSDSLFGAVDLMKYIPMAIVGVVGIILISNGKQILEIGERQFNCHY